MTMILVELETPLADGRAAFFALQNKTDQVGVERVPLPAPGTGADADAAEQVATLVEDGAEQVVVSLDRLAVPDADAVSRITSFVWSVLAAGAQIVVLASDRDVADVVRHFKMDRAFAICGSLEEAVARLASLDDEG